MEQPYKISLKAARVNANLVLIAAAAKIGVGKDTLMKWERKPWLVNPVYQERILEAYAIPIDMINFYPPTRI